MLPGNRGKPGPLGEKGSGHHTNHTNVTTGVVYIRWGRTSCPGDAQLLYKGETGLGKGCKNSTLEQTNTGVDSNRQTLFEYF